ncbi:MAG TPA: hypothetical protein VK941_13610 [Gillisia sp.]|nr:hypothetical protein [Gillisia sp.]
MKILSSTLVLLLFCALLNFGCSNDDSPLLTEEFLTATVGHEKWSVNSTSGKMHCEKILANYGAIDLLVRAESHNGRNIEFRILNYKGKGRYSFGDNPMSKSWINYSEASPPALWSAPSHLPGQGMITNRMEITDDDGAIIKGNFEFSGYENTQLTWKSVSRGNFNLRVRPMR